MESIIGLYLHAQCRMRCLTAYNFTRPTPELILNMVKNDNLNLCTIRLKATEQWKGQDEGFAFILPISGVGNYISGPFARHLSTGDVLVLNMAENNSIRVPAGEEFSFNFFTLRLEPLISLFSSQEACQLRNLADSLKTARFYLASENIAIDSHKLIGELPSQINFHHRSQLLRIAAGIFSLELNRSLCQRKTGMRVDEQITQVFEQLSVDEIMNLSASELAIKFKCSRRHLNRLFHQQFGYSVAYLKMEMRLLKAASLLRDPNAKIVSVAEDCGFNHLGMFNSLFKKRFGASPSHWREDAPRLDTPSTSLQASNPSCPLIAKGLCPWAEKPNRSHPLTLMRPAA